MKLVLIIVNWRLIMKNLWEPTTCNYQAKKNYAGQKMPWIVCLSFFKILNDNFLKKDFKFIILLIFEYTYDWKQCSLFKFRLKWNHHRPWIINFFQKSTKLKKIFNFSLRSITSTICNRLLFFIVGIGRVFSLS